MSDIKVGDLVMVVRPSPCCGSTETLGLIFRVARLEFNKRACVYCSDASPSLNAYVNERSPGPCWDVRKLKRIDPLPESVEDRDEVTA